MVRDPAGLSHRVVRVAILLPWRRLRPVLLAGLLSSTPVAQSDAQNSAQVPAREEPILEEVMVTGVHPGPGLWKVSHGDHVLWILGTQAPLPRGLVWRSEEVELAIMESQEVLGNYLATFTIKGENVFESKGRTLRSLLPRKSYSQWLALKNKYIGPIPDTEKLLPVTAATLLRSSAFERSGMTSADQVWREIHRLAEEYRLPLTTDHQVDKIIDSAARNDAESQRIGVEYLIDTMAKLEPELRSARASANAWAVGDIAALRKQAEADRKSAYLYANSWPFLKESEKKALRAETDQRWLEAAASALERNRTTFTALPMFLILQPDGLLAELSARGFVVEEPTH